MSFPATRAMPCPSAEARAATTGSSATSSAWMSPARLRCQTGRAASIYHPTGLREQGGRTSPGEANIIAFNGKSGIHVNFGTGQTIRGNAIFNNAGLGIELGFPVSPSPNDPGDADTGPNDYQNFPVLTGGLATTTNVTIQGTLNSMPNTSYDLDFYANLLPDSTGYGEGRQYLGSSTVATLADSNADFNVTFPVVAQGRYSPPPPRTRTAAHPSFLWRCPCR